MLTMTRLFARLIPLALLPALAMACSAGGQGAKTKQPGPSNWPSSLSGVASYQASDRSQMLMAVLKLKARSISSPASPVRSWMS